MGLTKILYILVLHFVFTCLFFYIEFLRYACYHFSFIISKSCLILFYFHGNVRDIQRTGLKLADNAIYCRDLNITITLEVLKESVVGIAFSYTKKNVIRL